MEMCELSHRNPWYQGYKDKQGAFFQTFDLETTLSIRLPEESFADILNVYLANWNIDGGDRERALVSIPAVNELNCQQINDFPLFEFAVSFTGIRVQARIFQCRMVQAKTCIT